MEKNLTLTRFHYPAHPSGGPYCENYARVVLVDDVVSIGGQTIEELVAEAEEGYDVSKLIPRG